MMRSQQRKQQEHAQSELVQKHAQFVKEKTATLTKLDERMDELGAAFHDQVISADYDASQLQDKYVKSNQVCRAGR